MRIDRESASHQSTVFPRVRSFVFEHAESENLLLTPFVYYSRSFLIFALVSNRHWSGTFPSSLRVDLDSLSRVP